MSDLNDGQMPVPLAIVGATGFLGGELVRLLSSHPRVKLSMLCGHSSSGKAMASQRPSLASIGQHIEAVDPDRIAAGARVALLALPHGESAMLAAQLLERGVKVVDLGSDFRLRDSDDYPRYYQREHPHPELLSRAVYSLPELTGKLDRSCELVANPGCFATALALGIVPLVPHLTPGARIAAMGVTGSSGSGAAPSSRVHHSLRPTNLCAYRPLTHQHLGELRQLMRQEAGREVAVDFVPHSGPFIRGIHLTLHLRSNELEADPLQVFKRAYTAAPLISVDAGPVALAAVVGSNRVLIGVHTDDDVQLVFVAIDNLLKGGSGQAVQNLNLLMGWPELEGLPTMGMWP